MQSHDSNPDLEALIASSADVCMKPWRHAVVSSGDFHHVNSQHLKKDWTFLIQCRNQEGERFSNRDIEIEIYQSGDEINLILGWFDQPERPILWQGKHPVWMNGDTGERCLAPEDGSALEALARRLRALF